MPGESLVSQPPGTICISKELILVNLCNLTRAYGTATLTDSEAETHVKSNSIDKLNCYLYVIARHYHLNTCRERNLTCAVHSAEIKLWTILVSERSVTATLFLLQYIDRSLELLERLNLSRMAENHTTLDFRLVNATEKKTDIVTCLTLVKNLTEHLNACHNRLLILTKTEDFNLVTYMDTTCLDTAGSNSTTTCDREHVLYWHKEWLVKVTRRILNPGITSVHKFHNLLFPLLYAVKSTECRTADDRSIVAIKLILIKKLTHFHLNELKHFLIINHITLIEEDNKARNVHLTSEKYVLTCLRHRTVSSGNHDDSAIHLSGTGNHILHIVSVSRTVNVSVVTGSGLILHVRSIDCNTALFLLRSVINLIERLNL